MVFRGYFLKNDGAILSMAIWQYAMDFFSKKVLRRYWHHLLFAKNIFYGTGHLPNDAEDLLKLKITTIYPEQPEVPIMGFIQTKF